MNIRKTVFWEKKDCILRPALAGSRKPPEEAEAGVAPARSGGGGRDERRLRTPVPEQIQGCLFNPVATGSSVKR
jgi:hypothetical protein